MSVDRDQIRRDAEEANKRNVWLFVDAADVLALLAELEQVERERNSLSATLQMVDDRSRNL